MNQNLPELREVQLEKFKSWKVSECGTVVFNGKNRRLKISINSNGYAVAGGMAYVHRLVASAWSTGWFKGAQVFHLDGNKSNNNASNLKWRLPEEIPRPKKLFTPLKQRIIDAALSPEGQMFVEDGILRWRPFANFFGFNLHIPRRYVRKDLEEVGLKIELHCFFKNPKGKRV